MKKLLIGKVSEIVDGSRRMIRLDDLEICVFAHKGKYYAYRNDCVHQGGPACEGVVIGKVETVLSGDRKVLGELFSEEEIHFVCPWHGWEYDVRTGECATDRRLKIQKFEVLRQGDDIFVLV